MGYCMWQVGTQEFFIPREKLDSATAALNGFRDEVKSFEDHLYDADFEVETDADGNVNGLCYIGEKLTDQYEYLNVIVPFVKEGSYLEFEGEDFSHWRWVFRNGRLEEIYPKVIWD